MCCMYTVYSGMQECVIQIPSIPILVSVLFPSLHLKYFRIKFLLLVCNINRDDASGFRLDTLATHAKHSVPSVEGKEVLTTYTDYVNKYPSVLQTTSYNFQRL